MIDQVAIPLGLCHCGCGGQTNIAAKTDAKANRIKGRPLLYIIGHNRRKTTEDFEVDPQTGCHLWLRAVNNNGYGLTWRGGRMQPTHVWAWEQANGPVPEGLEIDHTCNVRRCINLAHLEAVTSAENARRRSTTKLTLEEVRVIRAIGDSETRVAVGARFGVHPSTISHIVADDYWHDYHS